MQKYKILVLLIINKCKYQIKYYELQSYGIMHLFNKVFITHKNNL